MPPQRNQLYGNCSSRNNVGGNWGSDWNLAQQSNRAHNFATHTRPNNGTSSANDSRFNRPQQQQQQRPQPPIANTSTVPMSKPSINTVNNRLNPNNQSAPMSVKPMAPVDTNRMNQPSVPKNVMVCPTKPDHDLYWDQPPNPITKSNANNTPQRWFPVPEPTRPAKTTNTTSEAERWKHDLYQPLQPATQNNRGQGRGIQALMNEMKILNQQTHSRPQLVPATRAQAMESAPKQPVGIASSWLTNEAPPTRKSVFDRLETKVSEERPNIQARLNVNEQTRDTVDNISMRPKLEAMTKEMNVTERKVIHFHLAYSGFLSSIFVS